eukprot:TRINITY_DN30680_c0_g1_i1.p1 TRINITY_DN30680_c0_g1~~TRINITY_DN30680_c0_g1_i1.p1  ORF type:complete len:425 (-),score=105.44 TRINITY_DN30680_c0_g1_i1:152-1426(-)
MAFASLVQGGEPSAFRRRPRGFGGLDIPPPPLLCHCHPSSPDARGVAALGRALRGLLQFCAHAVAVTYADGANTVFNFEGESLDSFGNPSSQARRGQGMLQLEVTVSPPQPVELAEASKESATSTDGEDDEETAPSSSSPRQPSEADEDWELVSQSDVEREDWHFVRSADSAADSQPTSPESTPATPATAAPPSTAVEHRPRGGSSSSSEMDLPEGILEEIERIKAACEAELRRHLVEWLETCGAEASSVTYEGWIAAVHPENVSSDEAGGGGPVVDARLYLEDSFHRRLWNDVAAAGAAGLDDAERQRRHVAPRVPTPAAGDADGTAAPQPRPQQTQQTPCDQQQQQQRAASFRFGFSLSAVLARLLFAPLFLGNSGVTTAGSLLSVRLFARPIAALAASSLGGTRLAATPAPQTQLPQAEAS